MVNLPRYTANTCIYDEFTYQPKDRHRVIGIVVVGGIGEERWTRSGDGGWGRGRGGQKLVIQRNIHFDFILNIIFIVTRTRSENCCKDKNKT